ncbi:unnamed protein product [Closterium sp. NIES-53]
MTYEGAGFMCKIEGRMNGELYRSILKDELQQTIEHYELDPEAVVFQHDNDPKQTCKMVQSYLADQPYAVLPWPASSPDLNPTEHLWVYLKKQLLTYPRPPAGILELWDRVQAEWEKIPASWCSELIESMPRRVRAVLKAKGRWTKLYFVCASKPTTGCLAKKTEDRVAGEARQRCSNSTSRLRHHGAGTNSKATFRGSTAAGAAAAVGVWKDEEVTDSVEIPRTEMRVVVRTVYHGSHNHPPPPPDASTTGLLRSSSPCPAAETCASATALAPVAPGPAATAWTPASASPPAAAGESATACVSASPTAAACTSATACTCPPAAAATACAPAPAALPFPAISSTPPLSQSSATSSFSLATSSFPPATSPFPPATSPLPLARSPLPPATSPFYPATSCGPLTTSAPVTTCALASFSSCYNQHSRWCYNLYPCCYYASPLHYDLPSRYELYSGCHTFFDMWSHHPLPRPQHPTSPFIRFSNAAF